MSTKSEINSLKESYDCNLATFKEYYVLTKQFPNDQDYLQKFTDAKNNMIQLSKSLFLLNNRIQKQIEDMKSDSDSMNTQLDNVEEDKQNISQEITYAESQVGGAKQLSDDYKTLYTNQYILNWSFFVGILATGWITYRTFSKKEY